ncbi:MAG: hypothetical protein QOE45_423 [Frankiaceae bacterium]|nr:hypothetical protein [Frankiaceae bacterium]
MRTRSGLLAAALVAGALLAPFATAAHATTTTATLIAFVADPDEDDMFSLYTRPADGSAGPTQLFTTTDDVWAPALSPDGTKVAYVQWNPDTGSHLYVRPVAGGAATLLVDGGVDEPAWSRDGLTVAFTNYGVGDIPGIWTVPASGGGATQVAGASSADQAAFSPSGRQLLVTSLDADGFPVGIDVLTLSTHTRTRLTGATEGDGATWSPDGQTVVFVRDRAGCGSELVSVPASGAAAPTVVRSVEGKWADSPQFANDGAQIFWSETPYDCELSFDQGDTWVAAADGSGPAMIGTTATIDEAGLSVAGGTLAADTNAPAAAVIDATGVIAATSATITWTGGPDVSEYAVVRKPHGDPAPTSPTDGTLVYDGAARTATATGLTAGTVYDLYVFAIDASNNVAPVSAAHPVRPFGPPVVTAPPLTSTVSTTVKFPVSWAGSAPQFQVLSGEKTRSSSGVWSAGPVFKTWYASTASKSQTFTGLQGHTYYFLARALDGYGNTTTASPVKASMVPFNENYSAMAYSAGWTTSSSASRYLTTLRGSTTKNASMTMRTETAAFTVIGDKCAACGQLRIYVDGVLKATVDTHAASSLVRQVLYAGPVLAGGVKLHTIKLVVVGTAGRPKVNLDGVAIRR